MTTDTKWTSRMVSFWVQSRSRLLFYSFVSALVGVGVALLINLAQDSQPSWQETLGGAVIGLCINTVIFSVDFLIIALPRRSRERIEALFSTPALPGTLFRTATYFVGGVLGFLLGLEVISFLFPSRNLDFSASLSGWLLFMGLLAIIVGSLIFAYESMRHRLRKNVEQLKEQEFAHKELELARDIQRRLLPASELEGPGFRLAARNRASRFVSGDFYDILRLGDGDLGLVIADVVGKGMGASLLMASVKAILPFVVAERSVAETLDELNRRLAEDLVGREFVALAYARYSPDRRSCELANAGLPDPYLISADGSQRALAVAGERLPLAARRGTRYESISVELVPGDRLLMFTDGLAERRLASGDVLGYEALVDLFPSDESAPAEWIEALFRRVEDEGESSLEDDWTALLLEVTAPVSGLEPARSGA